MRKWLALGALVALTAAPALGETPSQSTAERSAAKAAAANIAPVGVALVTGAAAPALASDTTELSTGGLAFVRNDSIDIQSEEIAISPREVEIRYRLFNKSDQDVRMLVAFPMPDIHLDGPDDAVALPTDEPVNLLGFSTLVNGHPPTTAVEQRVTALGIDRTELLRSLGIPFAPHLPATNAALDRLPPEKQDELLRIGLAEIEGNGAARHLAARWTLQTTHYWEQLFPADAETVIEHRYRPSVGRSAQTLLGSPDQADAPWYDEYKEKYCLEPEFVAGLVRQRKAANSKPGAPFAEERMDYLLRTGASPAHPIREFRLVIDKGAAENLISFCSDDVKPIGGTQFLMKKSDYVPDGNIAILILERLPQ